MERKKFQQKALKQTKQKKSKSAEFLMVREDREASEGTGNPAFNTSSPDLSAYQTSEKKVIRRDTLARTLAAHQQKFRLRASAEPKGNEYSRNYFDPLMDEEINPRQCGMEVSGEGERVPEGAAGSGRRRGLRRVGGDAVAAYGEETEGHARKGVILPGSASLEQELKVEGEGLTEYIPMSCLKTDGTAERAPRQPLTADLGVCKEGSTAELGTLTEVTHGSKGAARSCWKNPGSPQPLQMQMKCIRGLKNKAPRGSYFLTVSLLHRLGGYVLHWWQTEHLKTRTHPVRHDANFYNVGLYFHESLYVMLPPKKDLKPGMAFLFELFLLRGKYACLQQVVGWAAFPLYDNNLNVVAGKFKCPLLRGHYDQRLDNFRKIEDLICLDLDHWLCNLYFQVIKLPLDLDDPRKHKRHIQLPPKFPVCLMAEAEKAESGVDDTAGLSEKEIEKNICASKGDAAKPSSRSSQGSGSNKIGPCPADCDLSLSKEDRGLHNKETSIAWRTGETEDYSQDTSYLEELEEHRVSVCCSSVADGTGSGEFFKHLYFVLASVFSELQLAQWRSQGFWYIILLMASLWFLRLYLHYLSQWLFLQAISTPVTKFHFSPLTVELCYPASSLDIGEESLVVVVGPLMLNAAILPLVLIRWGCQLLFASCPDVLSKLIITMGLWTVLDPLAVFIVDTVLGRLAHSGETPVADAAKLYWMFERTMQSGILGVMLTVLLYILLFVISSLILYLYCLRLHSDSWILDAFQRIHSEETKFFIPYDLEISNQELSYIVKRAEQWRGINGERRKVAVYDYIWKSHGVQASISSCDLQQPDEIPVSALGPGGITSHVAVYTVYPSGFQELYRHFLRLPSGAIVEVFGDISGLKFIPTEVLTALQEHFSETDHTLEDSLDIKSREMKRSH
ncbi:orofacial cleft 1 candidate gene 1 protein [Camelus ferus]|uniref:Orofacial cleft 1 candidate gene 1 protein n=1 Tax=Camelus ferus TaxID=419612 RepID=A0A8B8RKK3_CAMFR|nr:orofacial cleft 1 candidate gene 1 protein [Camelus ferus]